MGQRVPAMTAAEFDPKMFGLARPFQGKKALDKPLNSAIQDATTPRAPALEVLKYAELAARKARTKAVGAQTRAMTKGNALPIHETNKDAAIALHEKAKRRMAEGEIEAIKQSDLASWRAERLEAITDALTGRDRAGPRSSTAQLVDTPPLREGPPPTRQEAREMAKLLFDERQAELLDDVLSGRVTPRPGTDHHFALAMAATAAVGVGGVVAMANTAYNNGERRAIAAGRKEPKPDYRGTVPDPRPRDNWERDSRNRREVEQIQIWLNDAGGYGLDEDGKFYRNDDRPSGTATALSHWQAEHNYPPGPFTSEQRKELEAEALAARRQQPVGSVGRR